MRDKLILAAATVTALCMASCGNNGCEETRETFLYAQVKATGRISINKLNAWGFTHNGDSLMLIAGKPTELEFILKPDTTITQIRLETVVNDNGDLYQYNDTLTVSYEPVPYFIDMECGCSMFFNLHDVTVTDNLFRKVTLKNKEITNEETINIVLEY